MRNIVLSHKGRVELQLRYAPMGTRLAWDDPVFDETYRWCDAIRDRLKKTDTGDIWWGGYGWGGYGEDGVMTLVMCGPDLERLWAAIGPIVDVLPVLPDSDAWIRRGAAPGVRDGPPSRKLWER